MRLQLASALVLLSFASANAQDDRQLWQEIQGTWGGTLRLKESSCRNRNGGLRVERGTFRIRAVADLDDPNRGGELTGRTRSRRYTGIFFGSESAPNCDEFDDKFTCPEFNGATASFVAYTPFRMSSGRTCTLQFAVDYFFLGGPRAEVELTKRITCFGEEVCRTFYRGTHRKLKR